MYAAKGAGYSKNLDTFLSFNDFASLTLFAAIRFINRKS
jgi:hypothetical protein